MKNKYFRRGMLLVIAGVALNIGGYLIKEKYEEHYSLIMILGTILFCTGFISVFYSFFRKIEYNGIIEERVVEAEKKEKRLESEKS